MKWYVIMKLVFKSEEDKKAFKKGSNVNVDYQDTPDLGGFGTGGNPTNHFPSCRIKMHQLNSAETNPLILYKVMSTNY
jgi:hypothetical protein